MRVHALFSFLQEKMAMTPKESSDGQRTVFHQVCEVGVLLLTCLLRHKSDQDSMDLSVPYTGIS